MASQSPYTYERELDPPVVIQILTWFLLIASVFSYLARLTTKLMVKKVFLETDDYLITAALVFAICQSAAIAMAAINGLGNSTSALTPDHIDRIQKWQLTSTILMILSICFSRLAYLALVRVMTPRADHRRRILLAIGLVIAWAAIAILVTAFGCRLPDSWNYTQSSCIDRAAWIQAFDIIGVIIDGILIMLPTVFILSVQAGRTAKKLEAVSYFWIRIFVIAAFICDAVFWSKVRNSPDIIRDAWTVTICAQCVQALSIITVAALYLKPFVKMLQSGFLRFDDIQRRGSSKAVRESNRNSAFLSYLRRTRGRAAPRTTMGASLSSLHEAPDEHAERRTWDGERSQSQNSRAHFLAQTRSYSAASATRDAHTASTAAEGAQLDQQTERTSTF